MDSTVLAIVAIAFLAAVVNGALGYGFSSIAVPLALLFVSNRELTPAIVLLEVGLNSYVFWMNRHAVRRVWRRIAFVAFGLPVGVIAGTTALATVDVNWLKLITFGVLLPLILLQTAGVRRAIRAERVAGAGVGAGVGALYAVTTISGPPLALYLNNQGFTKADFRSALAAIRIVVAVVTAVLYARAHFFTSASIDLLFAIVPAVALGIPVGSRLLRQVHEETFRRVCMAFDSVVVAYGIAVLLQTLHLTGRAWAYVPLGLVGLFVAVLLTQHARARRAEHTTPLAAGSEVVA